MVIDVFHLSAHQRRALSPLAAPLGPTYSPATGRGLVATRNITAGEQLFSEPSMIAVPPRSSPLSCSYCCRPLGGRRLILCPQCLSSELYCSRKCRSMARDEFHVLECRSTTPKGRDQLWRNLDRVNSTGRFSRERRRVYGSLRASSAWKRISVRGVGSYVGADAAMDDGGDDRAPVDFLEPTQNDTAALLLNGQEGRLVCRVLWRALVSQRRDGASLASALAASLEGLLPYGMEQLAMNVQMQPILSQYRQVLDHLGIGEGERQLPVELYQCLVATVKSNLFNLCHIDGAHGPAQGAATKGGGGMYAVASLINHSCAPNVSVSYAPTEGTLVTYTTTKDIRTGEEIVSNYGVDITWPVDVRRDVLFRSHHFLCRCTKCETESGMLY
ncbi:unnamed protein product [Vitrella brassicaformis CCMP3155]|uniref:SET domain-containing protein n=3 Tax=Vitrella brassicaformis TaxID=1169539 RepID=A0A0G4EW55_VITBC|nr:unnamed protein product [Vitrella brassicaformis CCMP3155]|mmetsp:Transcript_34127/g.98303  ORF Transcript_34127/g.98303 Transcript_34127/m.98303 type:complete len:387 (+) Transcript_34127:204-1364(+)|eukprot:CEM02473.1 unnamed protein product [Vitrella brassicaformis CCMP3155]